MRTLILGLISLVGTIAVAAAQADARIPDAEKAAEQYMSAFFHGDLKTAASLAHPQTLEDIKTAFTRERAAASAAGTEAEFLAKSGIAASTDLDALDLVDFYVTVVSGSRHSTSEAVAAMKTTVVAVKGSERTEGGAAVVTLAITTPAAGGTRTIESRQLLRMIDGQWKVVGNAK